MTAVLIVVLLASAVAVAKTSEFDPPPDAGLGQSFWPVVGEAAGGLGVGAVTTAAAWAGLYFATRDTSADTENQAAQVALTGILPCLIVYPLGSAAGATIAGGMVGRQGTYFASAAGAGVGVVAGLVCFVLGGSMSALRVPLAGAGLYVLALAAPPAGAVIGYNISNRARTEFGLGPRLLPPQASFEPVRPVAGGRRTFRANIRLVTVRL
jgi:hypothetical protein